MVGSVIVRMLLAERAGRTDPIGALAHLQLGRALALPGGDKARAAYQDFLTLWADADRDIPILIEAKKEFAALD